MNVVVCMCEKKKQKSFILDFLVSTYKGVKDERGEEMLWWSYGNPVRGEKMLKCKGCGCVETLAQVSTHVLSL